MMVTQCVVDGMCLYRFRVYDHKGQTFKCYVARITGPDPKYILKRVFDDKFTLQCKGFRQYTCLLKDGIYEQVVKRFDADTGELLEKDRHWLVVLDGKIIRYPNDEMNYQYVLYSAFNLALQSGRQAV